MEGSSFAGQGEDVGGCAFTEPVPGRKPGLLCEVAGAFGSLPGQPFVEQADGDPDAAGDGRGRVVRRLRLDFAVDNEEGFWLIMQDPEGNELCVN